ncbi:MAG TPA: hypothetical protein VGB30_08270 [bacterium]|jgi:regulator of replication initiation timing
MSEDRVSELEKEIRELNLKLEIERQKNRKLEQENQKLKDKLTRQTRAERTVKVAAPPSASIPQPSAMPGDSDELEGGATEEEVDRLRDKLRTLTAQKDNSEQEKWDQSKEVIEHKETLQRLRVKKINIKKDIEELNERLDRKENQNFKSRLEITDLKKEESRTHRTADDAEAERIGFEEQIAQVEKIIEGEKDKLKVEKIARDKIQFALNRAQKIKAEYESHFFARFYNK